MPRKEVYLSISRLGSRLSGSVHSAVTNAMAPLRLAMSLGRPAWAKIGAKESPMTIVYWSEAEAQRMATKDEGIHADFSPTVSFHAAPHVLVPVATHTRPTMAKQ